MSASQDVDKIPNGPGGAAILAAGIGCAAMGILAFAGVPHSLASTNQAISQTMIASVVTPESVPVGL